MKKIISVLAITLVLASCGSKSETKTEDFGSPDETGAAGEGKVDVIAEGEALVKKSDCKTCHHATNKIIGPSHTDVAKKYEFTAANVTMLAGKIINGGAGVWGEVPMTAHVDITQADAEKMARYVLSLDGEKEH
jgi:cytochrome c